MRKKLNRVIRITTSTVANKADRDDRSRMSEVIFYGPGPLPVGLPNTFMFGDINIQLRPYYNSTNIVVQLNVYSVVFEPQYRATLLLLLGNKFGPFVHRRIRSHRRWGTEAERPNIGEVYFESIVEHIILQVTAQQATQARTASPQTEQLATT